MNRLKRWLMDWREREYCAQAAEEVARAIEESADPQGKHRVDRRCPPWLAVADATAVDRTGGGR